MTLRDIGDGLASLMQKVEADFGKLFTESVLDWPLYLFPVVIVAAFLALVGVVIAKELVREFFARHESVGTFLARAAFLLFVWFIGFALILGILLGGSDELSDSEANAAVLIALAVPTVGVAALLLLAAKGRRATRRENEEADQ